MFLLNCGRVVRQEAREHGQLGESEFDGTDYSDCQSDFHAVNRSSMYFSSSFPALIKECFRFIKFLIF